MEGQKQGSLQQVTSDAETQQIYKTECRRFQKGSNIFLSLDIFLYNFSTVLDILYHL